ncbi:hypothetical protein [Rhodanobacter sp. DHG33]|uniref:hypothetical protein n=1 Tax=Rhodanobacter sp. DHG33 TaxID=2775921 RepID=UPI00178015A9|nr:hypothetical protein [Rhodanobacter sp. DHG33]MBD8897945.1 hypothetical protein [Rhodanobacter sp. DHG33]
MSQESRPESRNGHRIWAGILLLAAMAALWTDKPPASLFSSCGLLLGAWVAFYYPGPGFGRTPQEIYRSARQGRWITPRSVMLVSLLSIILLIIGSIYHYRQ